MNGTTVGNDGVRTQHVFARASDGSLVHYTWVNFPGWTAENLTSVLAAGAAGKVAGQPVALNGPMAGTGDAQSMHVFARSTSGHLIEYRWIDGSGWSFHDLTTEFVGPNISSPPVALVPATIDASGRGGIHVFARGSANALIRYEGSAAGNWTHGNLSTGPSPLPVRAHLVVMPGLATANGGLDELHVASKGTTNPVLYDWVSAAWTSHVLP